MCTPKGMGFWYYKPTDCGAFGQMGRIFKEGIHRIPSIFGEVVKRFGKCVIKRGVLSLPSPFLDVKVGGWCLPKPIQILVKGLVGTFRFVFAQIKAGIAGCKGSHAKQPICVLVTDIKKIGDKIKAVFSGKFMQQTAELVGEKVHGDKHALGVTSDAGGVKCGGEWAIFFKFGGAWSHSNAGLWGISLSLGFTISLGCRKGTLYPDFIINFGASRVIFGAEIPGCMKFGLSGTLGFNIAAPSNDIVSASASVDIAGAIVVGKPGKGVKIKAGLGFKILPKPDVPMGFAVTFSAGPKTAKPTKAQKLWAKAKIAHLGCGLLQRQQQEEEEGTSSTSLEDSLYSAVGRSIQAHLDHDYEDMFESGQFMAAIELGASAMGNMKGQNTGIPPIAPDELTLSAGLALGFCITCFPGIRPSNDGTVMTNPYTGKNAGWKIAGGRVELHNGKKWTGRVVRPQPRPRPRPPPVARHTGVPGSLRNGLTVGLLGGRHRRWCADEVNRIRCNRGAIHGWEKFYVWSHGGRVALRGGHARRWCADDAHGVRCNRGHIHGWEKFWVWSGGGRVAFKGGRGHRWCADEGHRWICNRGHIHGWEKFQVHNVVTSPLRNGQTVGLLGGRHRRWCADEYNRIRCNRGWIHGWERFYVWSHGGRIALRGGHRHRWCADDHHGVRCNRGHIHGWEKFWLWSGGGRVAFKGGRGHRWCADEGHRWICNRGHIHGWEKFQVRNVR